MSTETFEAPSSARRRPTSGPMAKRMGLALTLIIVVAVVTAALLPDGVWKRLVVHLAARETGREVTVDNVRVRLLRWSPEVSVDGLKLANADWLPSRPMLAIRRLEVQVSLLPLLGLRLEFRRVSLDGVDVDLERDANNRANWDFSSPGARKPLRPDNSPPARLPVVKELSVSGGTLMVNDAIRKLKFRGEFSISKHRAAATNDPFTLRGRGALNRKPFDLRVEGGSLFDVDTRKPYDFDATMTASDIKLTAHTQIQHPFDLATLTTQFHLTGRDLADAYYLTGLALPNTPPYDVSGTLARHPLALNIDDLHGKLGTSDIEGKLSIDTSRDRPKLIGNLRSKLLNLADLAAPLGTQASPELKSETLSNPAGGISAVNPTSKPGKRARAAVAATDPQAIDSGYLLPDADLEVNRISAMDADVHFEADAITTTRMPMKKVRFHLVLDDAKMTLNPLAFTLPEGQFSGTVTVNARGATPETAIDMKLDNVSLTQFKPKGSDTAPLNGKLVGRIRLQGTGTSLHKAASNAQGDITLVVPHGDMRAAFAELLGIDLDKGLGLLLTKKEDHTEVRCGIASFHAEHGDLKASTLLFDTTNVMVTGDGNIDLRSEALNLSLRGQPKKVRLVRLRSPIKVTGTLAHPDIGLDARKALGQAGEAAALGVILTPFAALLAFVDGGLAKDANCAAAIDQANHKNNPAGGKPMIPSPRT